VIGLRRRILGWQHARSNYGACCHPSEEEVQDPEATEGSKSYGRKVMIKKKAVRNKVSIPVISKETGSARPHAPVPGLLIRESYTTDVTRWPLVAVK